MDLCVVAGSNGSRTHLAHMELSFETTALQSTSSTTQEQ